MHYMYMFTTQSPGYNLVSLIKLASTNLSLFSVHGLCLQSEDMHERIIIPFIF